MYVHDTYKLIMCLQDNLSCTKFGSIMYVHDKFFLIMNIHDTFGFIVYVHYKLSCRYTISWFYHVCTQSVIVYVHDNRGKKCVCAVGLTKL